jgi:Caspase domain
MSEQNVSESLGESLGPIAKRWAVLVGINSYDDDAWSTLKYCVADVVALEQALEGLGFEPVVCLHDESRLLPTKEKVETALRDLKGKVGPNDLVFVHFACHGMVCEDEKGDGKRKPFLVMKRSEKRSLAYQGWSVGQVEQWMRESGARRLFLSLDACHTGVDMGRGVDDDAEFLYYAYDVLPEGLAVLSASTAQQQAKEMAGLGHGVYTYYLLEALSGKAVSGNKSFITVGDIERYVRVKMEWFQKKNLLAIQEPTKWSVGRGAEDMKVVDWSGGEMTVLPKIQSTTLKDSQTETRGVQSGESSSDRKDFLTGRIADLREDVAAIQKDWNSCVDRKRRKALMNDANETLLEIEELNRQLGEF